MVNINNQSMEGAFADYMTDKGFLNGPSCLRPECQSREVGQVSKAWVWCPKLSNQTANITCLLQAS